MEKEHEQIDKAAKNSFMGAILGAVLVVIVLIGLLYVTSQRSKMDKANNQAQAGGTPPAADDPAAIANIVKNTSIKPVALFCAFALVVGMGGMLFLSLRYSALNELSLASLVMLAILAASLYVVFRLVESSFSVDQETADNFPLAVYGSVVSIQTNLTAALALLVLYLGSAYVSYKSARSRLPEDYDVRASAREEFRRFRGERRESPVDGKGRTPPSVPGGYINHRTLDALRARALRD